MSKDINHWLNKDSIEKIQKENDEKEKQRHMEML